MLDCLLPSAGVTNLFLTLVYKLIYDNLHIIRFMKRNFYPPFPFFGVFGLKQTGIKHCRGPTRRASLGTEQLKRAFYSQNFDKHIQVKEASLSHGRVQLTKAPPSPLVSQIENSWCSCDTAGPQISQWCHSKHSVCVTFSHKDGDEEYKMWCLNAAQILEPIKRSKKII